MLWIYVRVSADSSRVAALGYVSNNSTLVLLQLKLKHSNFKKV